MVLHKGGCHCGRVRWEVEAPAVIEALNCNCSVCVKKANLHFIVPEAKFKLVEGEDNLTCYQFNTKTAKHLFCKICGVQSFYVPRSNPDGFGVNPRCIDEGTVETIVMRDCDGKNWEKSVAKDKSIQSLSE